MDQTRFDQAMGRMSQAMKRVELAAEALATQPRAAGGARDEALRARVSQTIEELDTLIESLAR